MPLPVRSRPRSPRGGCRGAQCDIRQRRRVAGNTERLAAEDQPATEADGPVQLTEPFADLTHPPDDRP